MLELKSTDCFCETCDKPFHYLGIARHRAMHRDKKENCVIQFTNGTVKTYRFDGSPECV